MSEEQVNSPDHYNKYPVEVIKMMEKIFGIEATYHFCILSAFKYRMRMGVKGDKILKVLEDFDKEAWYLKMAAVYKKPDFPGNVIPKKEKS